jgi:hypothetical protein
MQAKRLLFRLFLFFLALNSPTILHAQQNRSTSEILTLDQVMSVFTVSVKRAFKIDYPIFRVYKYADQSGQYFCVLTESFDSIETNEEGKPDTLHHAIRAIDLKADGGRFTKVWELNDFISKQYRYERSIWFWTTYVDFQDVDNDGLIEPILVYGTNGRDAIDGPRVKIMIYYKGHKVAIRHKESDLDEGRETALDNSYETLPAAIKMRIETKMKQMDQDGRAHF